MTKVVYIADPGWRRSIGAKSGSEDINNSLSLFLLDFS